MKRVLPSLQLGDRIEGFITEVLDSSEFIVSFHGDLSRVRNQSARTLRAGDVVSLQVIAVGPLRFQLADDSALRRRNGRHIDFTV